MIRKSKCKPHQGENDRKEHARKQHRERMLDDALKDTFPAWDPVSIVLPTPACRRPRQVETSSWGSLQFRKHRSELIQQHGLFELHRAGIATLISLRRLYAGSAINAYSTHSPARQPISQKSVSSRVASLKIVTSSASRAGVT